MDAAHDIRRQLGQLMVDEGLLSQEQLTHALAEQSRTGRPLGKVVVELGYASEGAVANALAEQHGGLLRTEYGTSAGLRAVIDERRPRPPVRPRPKPVVVKQEPDPDLLEAAPDASGLRVVAPASAEAPPQSDPLVSRNAELEAQVQSLIQERNMLAQSLNELRARLNASHGDDGAVAELQAKLQAAIASRDELDKLAGERLGELEGQLRATLAEREPLQARAAAAEANAAATVQRVEGLEQDVADRDRRLGTAVEELARVKRDHLAELEELAREPEEPQEPSERIEELERAHAAALEARDALLPRLAEFEIELARLRDDLADREQRLAELEQPAPEPEPEPDDDAEPEQAHLLFVPAAAGYKLLEQPGAAPGSGTTLDLDGVAYVVRGVGRSPLPDRLIRCALLERL